MCQLLPLEVALNNTFAGLTETVTQQWPTYNEAEVPEYAWHNVEKTI